MLLKLLGKRTERRRDERTLNCLYKLGTLWIRVAQTLLVRSPKLNSPFGLKLLDLRDPGCACSFSQVDKILIQEFDSRVEDLFDVFEKEPFAASTFSQIHRAKLRNEQVWVAVKIQHEQSQRTFDSDLSLIYRMIKLMKMFSIQRGMRWDDLYNELKEIKTRELNFLYEAHALKTMDKKLAGQPAHVPRVYEKYCTQRILVMEFIQGALLSDCIHMQKQDPDRLKTWLNDNNIDLDTVGRRLFETVFRQVFEHNFFHGDMHTGNIILLRNSHFAVIECRSAGSLEVEGLTKQRMFLKALAEGEYITGAEIYFLMVTQLPRIDLNKVKDQLLRIWRVWETRVYIHQLDFSEKSLTHLTGQTNRVIKDSQFSPLWSYSKLILTWAHLDNALSYLSPTLNYVKKLRQYFRDAQNRDTTDKISRLPERVASAAVALNQMPERIASYTLFQDILMRREAQVISGSASKLDAVIAGGFTFCFFLVLIAAAFMLFAVFSQSGWLDAKTVLGSQLSALVDRIPRLSGFLWFLFLFLITGTFLFFRKQKNRFRSKEYGKANTSEWL
jgi:ubiquinone biosynthesis protein